MVLDFIFWIWYELGFILYVIVDKFGVVCLIGEKEMFSLEICECVWGRICRVFFVNYIRWWGVVDILLIGLVVWFELRILYDVEFFW